MSEGTNKAGCSSCHGGVFGSTGAVLAALLSWDVNHSILWGLVHAFFSWFYAPSHRWTYGEFLP